ncbi:uncharacterized protein DUF4178 [Pontibacter ummariensis]|uniref:DUF4178 domain-containing protein n=1 Tax=Pontibacter ummariensis TaxID=1610492 RepID=A0A239JUE6_9BACT|nr:DUF4178 domain-containing protein [Pontibacter ummariensis]PRY07420.1 uncharacterized protein DUF4178 [Pontibacter ummariensis]SNT09003.1 protein of unknown function [Pontibacter ummariensis]
MSGFDVVEKEKLPSASSFVCSRCTYPIPLVTHAQAVSVGCPNCGHVLQWQNEQWIGLKNLKQYKYPLTIPIGAKGRIKEVLYQVVGFVLYEETKAPYRWREYVLFNPLHGYAFLSEYDGHWTFFRYLADLPLKETHASSIYYGVEEYKLFHRYSSLVRYAEGEFPWRILESVSKYAEYIAPPYMLVQEVSADEVCWMQGEHIEPEVLREIFSISGPMPERSGVGAIEPFSKEFSFQEVAKVGGIACGVLLVLQVLFLLFNRPGLLSDQSYMVPLPQEEYGPVRLSAISGPGFELNSPTGSSNLELELFAPVYNDWFALGITLINTKTNKVYDLELGTEYYEGYSGGERWHEGSKMNDVDLSAMPNGTYNVILQPYKDRLSRVDTFRLWVREDVPLWSNFWIVLALLAVVPLVQWLRHHSHEKSRWMNSDYSTYTYD